MCKTNYNKGEFAFLKCGLFYTKVSFIQNSLALVCVVNTTATACQAPDSTFCLSTGFVTAVFDKYGNIPQEGLIIKKAWVKNIKTCYYE